MLNIRMNTSTKQLQEQLLSWLDEREEMESKIEDLGQSLSPLPECCLKNWRLEHYLTLEKIRIENIKKRKEMPILYT